MRGKYGIDVNKFKVDMGSTCIDIEPKLNPHRIEIGSMRINIKETVSQRHVWNGEGGGGAGEGQRVKEIGLKEARCNDMEMGRGSVMNNHETTSNNKTAAARMHAAFNQERSCEMNRSGWRWGGARLNNGCWQHMTSDFRI